MEKDVPGRSRNPSKLEFRIFSLQATLLANYCIGQLQFSTELREQILLGLFIKLEKTYRNMLTAYSKKLTDVVPVLARMIYELSLTIVYLLVNEDEDATLFEQFKENSSMRRYVALEKMEISPFSGRESSKEAVSSLKRRFAKEKFDKTTFVRPRTSSWHRNLSYYGIAKSLGGEFEEGYNTFYSAASIFIHPSWDDLVGNHLQFINDQAIGIAISKQDQFVAMCISTCFLLRSSETFFMKQVSKNINCDVNVDLIRKTRKVHHQFHNGKPDVSLLLEKSVMLVLLYRVENLFHFLRSKF